MPTGSFSGCLAAHRWRHIGLHFTARAIESKRQATRQGRGDWWCFNLRLARFGLEYLTFFQLLVAQLRLTLVSSRNCSADVHAVGRLVASDFIVDTINLKIRALGLTGPQSILASADEAIDERSDVCFWHKADIPQLSSNVRFWG